MAHWPFTSYLFTRFCEHVSEAANPPRNNRWLLSKCLVLFRSYSETLSFFMSTKFCLIRRRRSWLDQSPCPSASYSSISGAFSRNWENRKLNFFFKWDDHKHKKGSSVPRVKHGFNIYLIISKQTTQYYKILSAPCHKKNKWAFCLKKGHYQTSKRGINTNYVQIPAKIILLKNPTNSEFTSNRSIKQNHTLHTMTPKRDTHMQK